MKTITIIVIFGVLASCMTEFEMTDLLDDGETEDSAVQEIAGDGRIDSVDGYGIDSGDATDDDGQDQTGTEPREDPQADESSCTGVCSIGEVLSCSIGQCSGLQRCSAFCAWEACNIGFPPTNDTCETFIDVTAGGFFEGTTCGANSNYDLFDEGVGGPEVIYRMFLTSQSNVYIHTCNTLAPWPMGITITEGVCGIAYSRDSRACGPGGGARIEMTLDSGTYYIAVGGTGATNVGSFTLFVSIMPL